MRSLVTFAAVVGALSAALSAQGTPVPQPFPGSGSPSTPTTSRPAPPPAAPASTPPAVSLPAPAASAPPTAAAAPARAAAPPAAAIANVPLYPTAEYLETIDAGSGQQYVLYGVNVPFLELLAYYKTTLKTGGRELFKTPATHQFDLGRYQDDRMVYPPSIVLKDYTWNSSPGYLFVSGTTERRYKTIIQVVAPGPTP